MKAILLLFLFVVMVNRAVMAFNPLNWFVTKPPANNINMCNGRNRKWGFCSGNPPKRTTTDSCTRRTEDCDTGTSLASAFVESLLTPPSTDSNNLNQPNQVIQIAQRPSYALNFHFPQRIHFPVAPVTCNNGPHMSHGSYGNCNVNRVTRSINNPKRDLMILLDESGSVGATKFEKVKEIASGIVKLLCGSQSISPSQTRIGVISFDDEVHPYISLLDSNPRLNENLNSITHTIETIRYNSATDHRTCLTEALEYIDQTSFSDSKGGRRNKKDVVQEIIIITDGCANCDGNLASIRDHLVSKETSVYVIGIGLSNQCQENLQILGQGGKCYHFFYLDQWDDKLDQFIDVILDPPYDRNGDRFCLGQLYNENRECVLNN